jgi:CDP-6-deoxy-D-xylo-4-hexulose-3-dehydrase
MINLVKDTISEEEILELVDWLKTSPQLTKGKLTEKYESLWSDKIGCKYSVFVNSGSSALLISIYSLIEKGLLKRGDSVIVPALSWATDLSPVIQLGLKPVLCDCNLNDLSVDLDHLQYLTVKEKPKAMLLVSVLGLVPEMDHIVNFCENNDIILIEDACESLGSSYKGRKLGNFGLMSCFSTYYGHHLSTIEGGMVCTNDEDLFNLLKSLRSHGWDRDMSNEYSEKLRREFSIDSEFESQYKFYYLGFNLRSTDLQAFLGINQLKKFDKIVDKRNKNYCLYREALTNSYWQSPESTEEKYISNFAYPIIHPNRDVITKELKNNDIASRPLICGSLGKQPFWTKNYGPLDLQNADKINDWGFYLPNNHELEPSEIEKVNKVVKSVW